jgi:hypothetical protein
MSSSGIIYLAYLVRKSARRGERGVFMAITHGTRAAMHGLLLFKGVDHPEYSQMFWLEVHVLMVPQGDGHAGSV